MNIKELFIYCRAEDYEQIEHLLGKKKDGRYLYPRIITALAKHPVLDVLCEVGNLKILQRFLAKNSDGSYEFSVFTKAKRALEIAAERGNISVLEYLFACRVVAPFQYEFPEIVIISNVQKALEAACIKNNITVIKFILKKFPEIHAIQAKVLITICNKGYIELLNFFLSKTEEQSYQFPEIVQTIQADSKLLLKACVSGNISIVQRLMEKLPDGSYEFSRILEAISSHDYLVFKTVFHGSKNTQNEKILELLLQVPDVFAYVDSHGDTYAKTLTVFTQKYLEDLQQEIASYYESNPAGVFTLNTERTKLCYLIIKNAVRTNNLARINLLLSIDAEDPCEKILGNDAQLLKIAISYGRVSIIRRLLEYPSVRTYVENNAAFRDILNYGELELLEIALDKESAVVALTPSEQDIWDSIKQHYHERLIELGGVETVYELFRDYLKKCYGENPDYIKEIQLPLEISDLEKLRKELGEDFYNAALKKYYTNIYHTVYRYLSKPNPLLAADALFIETEGGLRFSLTEPYAEMIAYFYLAAADESFPCTFGGTVTDRVNLFIKNISLIARAHNWDPAESTSPAEFSLSEEVDDLQGDKPSCFSGVKKRLFSLPGHSLFDVLSKEQVQEKLRDFIRSYYDLLFTKMTREELVNIKSAIDSLFYEAKEIEPTVLKLLSIPGEEVSQFIVNLRIKYGRQFNSFELFIRRSLMPGADSSVFTNFYMSMHLGELFETALRSKASLDITLKCITPKCCYVV